MIKLSIILFIFTTLIHCTNPKTKHPSSFISVSKNHSNKSLQSDTQNLLQKYFEIDGFRSDSIAFKKIENSVYEIEFLKKETYFQNKKEFMLVFFTTYQLIESNNKLVKDISTGAIGASKFSIIKFNKVKNKWNYINKWDDLDTGINIREKTYVPHIIQKGEYTFLELPDIAFYASGTNNLTTTIFNTKNFKKSLEIEASSYNGLDNIDKFLIEMNADIYDENGNSLKHPEIGDSNAYSNTSVYRIEYKPIQKDLFVYVHRSDASFNSKKKKFIKKNTIEKYKYDNNTLQFIQTN